MSLSIKSITLVILMMGGSICLTGQKAEVEKKLREYNIPEDFFVDNLGEEDAMHAFTHTCTSISADYTGLTVSTFDPTRPEGARWELVSIDGREPTEKEIKQFSKGHNKVEKDNPGEPADEDWTILEENEQELIIGFRYREENLPHKYKFLAQCTGKVFIDKEEKQLDRVEFYNTEQVKIKIFKVDKLDMVQVYRFEEETGHYLVEREELLMDVRMLGQVVEVKEINEFSNYVKVK